MNVRSVVAAAAVFLTVLPVAAQSAAPAAPQFPKKFVCINSPAFANYDAAHDRFYVHYAAMRLRMDRAPGAPFRYVSRKRNVEWRLDNGLATFSRLVPGTDTVADKIADCTYRR